MGTAQAIFAGWSEVEQPEVTCPEAAMSGSMKSVTTGFVPSDRVSPVYKKGQNYNPENYRPISLTCICCKLLEHATESHVTRNHVTGSDASRGQSRDRKS
jgi:hypothetical protein